MNIKTIPIEKIKPSKYNPRVDLHPNQKEYQAIKKSLDEFGLIEPLIWNEHNGNLIGGHQRLKILIASGIKEIEVSAVNIEDEKKERILNIALNKIEGQWDKLKLVDVLNTFEKEDALLAGFTDDELKDLKHFEENLADTHESPQSMLDRKTPVKCPECGHEFET